MLNITKLKTFFVITWFAMFAACNETDAVSPVLTLENESGETVTAGLMLTSDASDKKMTVKANCDWSIVSRGGVATWAKFDPVKGTGETPITFHADNNTKTSNRSAQFAFMADGKEMLMLTVSQAASVPPDPPVPPNPPVDAPVADMLDIVFKSDGTAEDISAMHNAVNLLAGNALFTLKNNTYNEYIARFANAAGSGVASGFYRIDYLNNQEFKDKLADGHTIEALFTCDAVMPQDKEIKVFSSMAAGGTGLMISSDNQITFLPNISTTGNSSWAWTKSGVIPEVGRYYHVVGVWNKTEGKTCVYIDGEKKGEVSYSGNFNFPSNTGAYWFAVGGDAGTGSSAESAWQGDVAIARIYDKPLTAEEVAMLWQNANKTPVTDDIVISDLSYNTSKRILKGGSYTIGGKGFAIGDKIILAPYGSNGASFECAGTITDSDCKITLPDDFVTGRYRFTVKRGDKTLDLGVATLTITDKMSESKIVAHRGYWKTTGSAQNSITALQKAQQLGIFGSEFDVWITTDGRVMLNHDASYNGVTIQNSTYEQVKNLTLSNGEKMPVLEDFLDAGKASPNTILVLEIKTHSTVARNNAVVDACVEIINQKNQAAQVNWIAFSLDVCKRIVQKMPGANVAYLNGDKSPAELNALGINGIDYTLAVLRSHPTWVDDAHALGMSVNVWTLNSAADINEAINMGADFITTDEPVLAKQLAEEAMK